MYWNGHSQDTEPCHHNKDPSWLPYYSHIHFPFFNPQKTLICYPFLYSWTLNNMGTGVLTLQKQWKIHICDFPGGPMFKTPCFQCKEHRCNPYQETKIPHATRYGQKKKSTYDFTIGPLYLVFHIPGFNQPRIMYSCATYLLKKICVWVDPCSLNPYLLLFSPSIMSNLWPHEPQHARLVCTSPTPGVCSNSCPLSWWCHPIILSSVVPFSSCLQSFPASGSFPMSQFFASGGQSIGASASALVLPMNIQDWFPLNGLVGSPCSPRDSQESSPTPQFKSINSLVLSFLYVSPTLISIHDYWKNNRFD